MSIVYIIGAGPGDPGLLTIRGLECLAAADVVLYDHLVHARMLRYARPDAEKIDVGTAAPQALEQEAICYLLAEKAREGKVVARLKWGDPFVFDHGGAEAEKMIGDCVGDEPRLRWVGSGATWGEISLIAALPARRSSPL